MIDRWNPIGQYLNAAGVAMRRHHQRFLPTYFSINTYRGSLFPSTVRLWNCQTASIISAPFGRLRDIYGRYTPWAFWRKILVNIRYTTTMPIKFTLIKMLKVWENGPFGKKMVPFQKYPWRLQALNNCWCRYSKTMTVKNMFFVWFSCI